MVPGRLWPVREPSARTERFTQADPLSVRVRRENPYVSVGAARLLGGKVVLTHMIAEPMPARRQVVVSVGRASSA